MRKKTANVGRAPEPFPGTFDQLRQVIAGLLVAYESTPQRGSLKGRSPRQVYEEAIAAGWTMTAVEPDVLRIAFSTEEPRIVRQGRIRQGGRLWTCPELQSYLGAQVSVLIPNTRTGHACRCATIPAGFSASRSRIRSSSSWTRAARSRRRAAPIGTAGRSGSSTAAPRT